MRIGGGDVLEPLSRVQRSVAVCHQLGVVVDELRQRLLKVRERLEITSADDLAVDLSEQRFDLVGDEHHLGCQRADVEVVQDDHPLASRDSEIYLAETPASNSSGMIESLIIQISGHLEFG